MQLKQAYELGAQLAIEEEGLVKKADISNTLRALILAGGLGTGGISEINYMTPGPGNHEFEMSDLWPRGDTGKRNPAGYTYDEANKIFRGSHLASTPRTGDPFHFNPEVMRQETQRMIKNAPQILEHPLLKGLKLLK